MLHNHEMVTIEEILVRPQINRQCPIRHFILFNRNSNLETSISTMGPKVVSCKLNDHQILVDTLYAAVQRYPNYELSSTTNNNRNNNNNNDDNLLHWESHVFGSDTIRLYNLQDRHGGSLTYCLTKDNEFIIRGQADYDQIELFYKPFFFNLNYENQPRPTLEEHFLLVRSSHEALQLNCENRNEFGQMIIPSMMTSISHDFNCSDMIYKITPSNIPSTVVADCFLIATLHYRNRTIEVSLEVDKQKMTSLRILIQNNSVAFVPNKMNNFRLTYRFRW